MTKRWPLKGPLLLLYLAIGVIHRVTSASQPSPISVVSAVVGEEGDLENLGENTAPLSIGEDHGSDAESGSVQSKEEMPESNGNRNEQQHPPPPSCALFMAESTIPGAGLGMFSGVDLDKGDYVGSGDLVLPIVDLNYHMYHLAMSVAKSRRALSRGGGSKSPTNNTISLKPTESYVWYGHTLGLSHETAVTANGINAHTVSAFAVGMNSAANCHLGLINVAKRLALHHPSHDDDDTSNRLHRSKDPGAGAYTPYHIQNFCTHSVRAGDELFVQYGEDWFLARTHVLGLVPLDESYTTAEVLTKEFHRQIDSRRNLSKAVRRALWNYLVHDFAWPSRVINALPKDYDTQIQTVLDHGIREVHRQAATRSLSDLQARGRCLDYIEPRRSTMRQAGRGAFAKQFLRKGTKVTGSPLLFFPRGEFFAMYEGNWTSKDDMANQREKIVHQQIMYNYCWKHGESSIILCPYGGGLSYINHGNKSVANVRLEWAADGEMGHQDKWLLQSPKRMLPFASPGLFIDAVATRDIEADSEIFLDYGEDWESAWEQHQASWSAKYKDEKDYQAARDWNEANHDAILLTESEQEEQPYPNNFELRCLDVGQQTFTEEQARHTWTHYPVGGNPCRIIDRAKSEEGEFYYKVLYKRTEWFDYSNSGRTIMAGENKWIQSNWIPRGVLQFVDAAYSTDMWLRGAFRNLIGFPDDIMPDAWRGEYIAVADLV